MIKLKSLLTENTKIYAYSDELGEYIRNLRPPSAFMPGETAMCLRKAGLGEEYRKVMTRFIPNGKGITELSKPAAKLIDEKSWDVWQAAVKNTEYKYKQKKGPF